MKFEYKPLSGSKTFEESYGELTENPENLKLKMQKFREEYEAFRVDNPTFSEKASELMKNRKWNSTIFMNRTLLDSSCYYRVDNKKDKTWDFRTVIAICVGLELSLQTAENLLYSAGHAFGTSEKHQAYKFLFVHDVILRIRRNGIYATKEVITKILNDPSCVIEIFSKMQSLQDRCQTLELSNNQSKQLIGELQPKATYYDLILQNKSTIPITQIAKDYGMSGVAFNKMLHELGIRNEKYTGDMLLQKTFIEDHLSKKQIKNNGVLPQYYVENNHEPIISRDIFEKVQNEIKKRSKKKSKIKIPHLFTGKIKCGVCGAKFKHKINSQKPVWICNTFNTLGKSYCGSQQIPENILKDKLSEVGKISEIKQILVPENGTIIFCLKDGRQITKTWQNKSRSESWTPEMKQKAREKALCKQQ